MRILLSFVFLTLAVALGTYFAPALGAVLTEAAHAVRTTNLWDSGNAVVTTTFRLSVIAAVTLTVNAL